MGEIPARWELFEFLICPRVECVEGLLVKAKSGEFVGALWRGQGLEPRLLDILSELIALLQVLSCGILCPRVVEHDVNGLQVRQVRRSSKVPSCSPESILAADHDPSECVETLDVQRKQS